MLDTFIIIILIGNTILPFYLYIFLSTPRHIKCIIGMYIGIHAIFAVIYFLNTQQFFTTPVMILLPTVVYFGAVYWSEVRKMGKEQQTARELFSKYITVKTEKRIYCILSVIDVVICVLAFRVWDLELMDCVYMALYVVISISALWNLSIKKITRNEKDGNTELSIAGTQEL